MTEQDGPAASVRSPSVSVERISVSRDDVPVLTDVSFTARPGRTLIVLAPSELVRSTVVGSVLGLFPLDSGRVLIDGHDVHAPGLTEAHRVYLDELGLSEHLRTMPDEPSPGTRGRVGLAMALADAPPLIVLDDPTDQTHPVTRRKILESIRRAREDAAATVIVACHDVPTARMLGDDVLVLLGRRVIAAGPAHELLAGVRDAESFDRRFTLSGRFPVTQEQKDRSWNRVLEARRKEFSYDLTLYGVLALLVAAIVIMLILDALPDR